MAIEVLLAIAVILAVSIASGPLAARLRQPAVVGQILAGLGLGMLPGWLTAPLFPPDILPVLTVIAQIGLVFFLFTIGYELDLGQLRRGARAVLLVSFGGLAVPMLLGAALAWTLVDTAHTRPVPFVLFMSVAMAITAVPVLAWILRDRGLMTSEPGVLALSSAGVMDLVGWVLLTVTVSLVSATDRSPIWLAVLLPAYLAVLVGVVRPALRRSLRSPRSLGTRASVLTALVMASAWCTEQLGLHLSSAPY